MVNGVTQTLGNFMKEDCEGFNKIVKHKQCQIYSPASVHIVMYVMFGM